MAKTSTTSTTSTTSSTSTTTTNAATSSATSTSAAAPAPNPRRDPRGAAEEQVLTAAQAAALLGIKPATLYAYVSRGLLRSRDSPGSTLKRYARADVLRLKERADARKGHEAAARNALNWGAPVIESAITDIDDDGPHYRGLSPLWFWARGDDTRDPFLACAHWLALGEHAARGAGARTSDEVIEQADVAAKAIKKLAKATPPTTPLACLDLVLSGWRLAGPPGILDEEREWQKASLLLGHLCAAPVLLRDPAALPTHTEAPTDALRQALGVARDDEDLVARMLLVIADHELNASSFAARVAASTGATLPAALSAALATVSGPRHGGLADRIDALFDEVLTAPAGRAAGSVAARAAAVVGGRLSRGEPVPGFGHRLYPRGDPRARALLEHPRVQNSKDAAVAYAVIDAWRSFAGENALTFPAADLALVAACRALGLPAGTATAVFATGRAAGWIAHVFEQRASPTVLRPRARYTGPPRS